MIAVEAFLIMISKAVLNGPDMEMHTLVYNEKLNQLKHDFAKKWLFQHEGANITDLKQYLVEFAKIHDIEPEVKSRLEDYASTQDDFRETMTFLATKLNESGKVHIILMDEVDLKIVTATGSTTFDDNCEIDLSCISEYQNVHFVFCICPTSDGQKDFKIIYPKERPNQHFVWMEVIYRNCREIIDFISYVQNQLDPKSKEGYPKIGEILSDTKLPPPFKPTGYDNCVIWVPIITPLEEDIIEEIHSILDGVESNPVLLYSSKKSKDIAKKLKQGFEARRGPLEDVNYNGGEADVIVYITDGSLNIQTIARARRMLIILTLEKDRREPQWRKIKDELLLKCVEKNLVRMIQLNDFPPAMKMQRLDATLTRIQGK